MNIKKGLGGILNSRLLNFDYGKIILLVFIVFVLSISFFSYVNAAPAGPVITYVSNSTAAVSSGNRSQDSKGTITILTMSLNQQDYKWKAYVGNITGGLALDDANARTIYDWSLTSITGEIYATRASSVTWANVSCVTDAIVTSEQTAMGMSVGDRDNINRTFNYTTHRSFLVGTKNITASSCKSTATYVNDAAQVISESADFQEILLRDEVSSSLIYSAMIDDNSQSYDGTSTYDFQMIVAENESASIPTTYFFYVELG
ncbi:MAG: hypothetical protein ACP5NV_03765 [Candidatus Woesearchaeota archaeon]